jgi:hypothetical protein
MSVIKNDEIMRLFLAIEQLNQALKDGNVVQVCIEAKDVVDAWRDIHQDYTWE